MRKTLTIIAVTLLAAAGWTGAAGAQDGPSITVEPATVDAPGETEFTIIGEGWTAPPPLFILPCEVPESGNATDVDQDTCNTDKLTVATPIDGAFEVTATYDVPDGGIVIVAGDGDRTEGVAFLVAVGGGDASAEAGDETDAADGSGEGGDAPAEGDEGDAPAEGEDDAAAEGDDGGELAETGVESMLFVVVAMAVIAAGAMVLRVTRRTV